MMTAKMSDCRRFLRPSDSSRSGDEYTQFVSVNFIWVDF